MGSEPIALVGIGCRFPGGCETPSKLWELLKDPIDLSQEIPKDRFNIDGFYHEDGSHHGTANVRRSYLLSEDISRFDHQVFSIPLEQAEAIDPQQRLLLEVTHTQSQPDLLDKSSLPPLDWFIGFSSVVATMGNPGQANYAAANCFMKAIINQRRSQGLAGSVIDISRVVGTGYVEREMKAEGRLTRGQKERLFTGSMTLAMSETDLHALFAEAIVSGNLAKSNNGECEIITGMAPVCQEHAYLNSWPNNPNFGLLVKVGEDTVAEIDGPAAARIPVKKLLAEAKSPEEMANVLKEALTAKLRTTLFLPAASDTAIETTPLIDIGVDSLVGVDLRAWCLKELDVDIPAMHILGGVSLNELAEELLKAVSSNGEGKEKHSSQKD